MDPLLNIIYKIKQLPTMYIGKHSLTSLLDFLGGYICCLNDFVGHENRTFDLPEFYRYAQSVYEIADTPIKQLFLEQNDNDEEKAFDKFYELLDSFLNPDPEEMSKHWHEYHFCPPLPREHKLSELWRKSRQ
jgi:hypothetical protein